MKIYHNEANTGGITKIALNFFWDFFGHEKMQKSNFQCHFSMSKYVQTFLKKISYKNIN